MFKTAVRTVLMAVLCIGLGVAVLPAASSQPSDPQSPSETESGQPSETATPDESPTPAPSPSESEDGGLLEGLLGQEEEPQAPERPTLKKEAVPNIPNPSWRPTTRPIFNNPTSRQGRYKIERQLLKAIRNVPPGGEIRSASFSLDRVPIANALIAAYRRGVKVQVINNNHNNPYAQRKLRRVVGNKRGKTSFAIQCVNGCRTGRGGTFHSKFYLFSHTGASRSVVMVGSHNHTLNAVRWQWNDLMTARENYQLYKNFRTLFISYKKDLSRYGRSSVFCTRSSGSACVEDQDHFFTRVLPKPDHRKVRYDDTWKLLNRVDCKYNGHRTHLRLSMHSMRGRRGIALGKKIRQKYAEGCDFKVVSGLLGWHVFKQMGRPTHRGRVPIRSTGFDYNRDGDIERYTHHKYLAVRGKIGSRKVKMTLTGSQNWSTHALYSDEITVQVHDPVVTNDYFKNWNLMFYRGRYTRNAYTTTYQNW